MSAAFTPARPKSDEYGLAYWRARAAEQMRNFGTDWRFTEYGFMRQCRNRVPFPLAQLRMVETAIRCDVAMREALAALRAAA